jgi:non-canonical purine NTP pyrophosphatase (RdgB/HAM1 family)
MKEFVYITGNQNKADYMANLFGHPVLHHKLDLDEIQSMDLKKIVKHKVRQAYDIIKKPVVVEDTGLEFKALGGLPGPLIKYFIESMSMENICSLVDGKDRSATARCVFGYFDGQNETYFEGFINGSVAKKPAGNGGYGFDKMFVPEGFDVTRAELNKKDDEETYLKMKPIMQLKEFLMKG